MDRYRAVRLRAIFRRRFSRPRSTCKRSSCTAEDHFRKGKLNLEDNKRDQARDEFDKAVDTILESGLDVRASQRLQNFYLELVERIYREEVPLGPGTVTTQCDRARSSEWRSHHKRSIHRRSDSANRNLSRRRSTNSASLSLTPEEENVSDADVRCTGTG